MHDITHLMKPAFRPTSQHDFVLLLACRTKHQIAPQRHCICAVVPQPREQLAVSARFGGHRILAVAEQNGLCC